MGTKVNKLIFPMKGQNLPPLPTIRDIIRDYKLSAKRRLAQNFLLDMNLTRKIVEQAGDLNDSHVCEIGPGPGGITRAILENNIQELSVVEKDKRFLLGLQLIADSIKSQTKMSIYHADIMKFQMENLFPQNLIKPWMEDESKIHIIGNLPFNVSLPLFLYWLKNMDSRTDVFKYGRINLTLTFQKEVAERMRAPPGDIQRSRLSVITQSLAHIQHKFTFLGKACVPQPNVDIGVVKVIPKIKTTHEMSFNVFHKVVTAMFNFRRKYCRRGIDNLFPLQLQKELTPLVFKRLPFIDPTTPIFKLENEHFNDITHVYLEFVNNIPDLLNFDYRFPKKDADNWVDFDGKEFNQNDIQADKDCFNENITMS